LVEAEDVLVEGRGRERGGGIRRPHEFCGAETAPLRVRPFLNGD
jgi:hypothetical protein